MCLLAASITTTLCRRYHYELASEVLLSLVRPRASEQLKVKDLVTGDTILVNYNIDEPDERGYWYHAKVRAGPAGVLVPC